VNAPHWLYKLLARENLSARVKLGPEDRVGIEFADRLRVWSLEGSLIATWTHIPHEVGGGGGRSSQLRYAVAKALGLITGSGDYVFTSKHGGAWIEIKKPKTEASGKGRSTPEQKLFGDWCERLGVPYDVAYSADEAEALLRQWGMLI
jgi:hypothetical protein